MSNKRIPNVAFALLLGTVPAFGQDMIEGTVTGTKLTRCSFKPGGCEGSLVLETRSEGKVAQITIKVPLGTPIKKGAEDVYLPTLNGKEVRIVHGMEKGETVARSIEVLAAKP
ncbi:MAG: hypothetical protein AB1830_01180 [Pseudomonadota bacterium]